MKCPYCNEMRMCKEVAVNEWMSINHRCKTTIFNILKVKKE